LLNNNIFNSKSLGNRIKSDGYPFVELKKKLKEYEIDLSTQDINKPEDSKYIFCLDLPHHFQNFKKQANQFLYLIITEPEIYCPESWNPIYHSVFDKIFTYSNRFGFNSKYSKYTFAIDFEFYSPPQIDTRSEFENKKLCALVASAVSAIKQHHPNSLLYERYKMITWFGKYHQNDFDFYSPVGKEKDYYAMFRGKNLVKKILPKQFYEYMILKRQKDLIRVYKGQIKPLDKVLELKKYKFYVCYENFKDLDGYLTEKIFDCFYATCIPIYQGASNVKDLIPQDCYILRENFKSNEDLYAYIKNINYNDYLNYTNATIKFLNSQQQKKFTVAAYADSIISQLELKRN
jgi:hypothetical protein